MSASNEVRFDLRLSLTELRKAIPIWGVENSTVILGEPGTAKSSLLNMIAEDNGDSWQAVGDECPDDKYDYIYVDCPLRDVMDFGSFVPDRDLKKLVYYVSELLKPDSKKPKIVMLDELTKSFKIMMPMFTRLLLDKMWGEYRLPEGSYIIATGNDMSDGLGDSLLEHAGNRVTIVHVKKSDATEWGVWAAEKGLSRVLRAWVAMTPRCLASYKDGGQENNPYIFMPAKKMLSFVSLRSLHKSDNIIKNSQILGQKITKAGLAGTLGISAANDLCTFMEIENEVVDTQAVISDPEGIEVPEKIAAVCMMMVNAVDDLNTQDELSAFMKFVDRIKSHEMQNLFFSMLCANKRTIKLAQGNKSVQKWAKDNFDMLG